MAYSSTNSCVKVLDIGLTTGRAMWVYESTHAHAAIEAAGFFVGAGAGSPTNAALGMKVGDLLIATNQSVSGTSAITLHRVTSLTTSTGYGSPINASVSVGSS